MFLFYELFVIIRIVLNALKLQEIVKLGCICRFTIQPISQSKSYFDLF